MENSTPELTYASPNDPFFKTVLIKSIERLTGQRKLQNLYKTLSSDGYPTSFWQEALAQLQITLDYDPVRLDDIPRTGPVVFIANHPYGLIDGLAICHLASQVRREFKILINSVLCREERIEPYVLPIDFAENKEAVLTNINSKKEALNTLNHGGAIVIFPAGGISTAKGPFGQVTDLAACRRGNGILT